MIVESFNKVKKWVISNGYEILIDKPLKNQRFVLMAKKSFKPGFVSDTTDELKFLRLAVVVETADSLMSQDAKDQMTKLVNWKNIDFSNEKWMVLFVPEGVTKFDCAHLSNYDQIIEYPIKKEVSLENEPKNSPLGIKGWNP
jgi:hypothetical protein